MNGINHKSKSEGDATNVTRMYLYNHYCFIHIRDYNKMVQAVLFLNVLAFFITNSQTFRIFAEENLNCQSSTIQCISNTSYTTCASLGSFTILLNSRLTCPDGYICDDSTSTACISSESLQNETDGSSVTTTIVPDGNTVTNATTIESVTRPSGPPDCKAAGLWPAPQCNQYYECVKKTGFFAWGFQAELRTCDDGNNFDTASLACVPVSQSDCR